MSYKGQDSVDFKASPPEARPRIFPFKPWNIKLYQNDMLRLYFCMAADQGHMYLRAIGKVLSEQYHRFRMATFRDEAWRNGTSTLADMRWVQDSLSFEGMIKYVKRAETELARIGIYPGDLAIVTASDLSFGSSRMYEILSNQEQRGIFTVRTLDEAVQALQIDQAGLSLITAKIDELESTLKNHHPSQ